MNGRLARRQRKDGTRHTHNHEAVKMETSNIVFDRKLYRERRNKGLNGIPKSPSTYNRIIGEDGKPILIPSTEKVSHVSSHLQRKDSKKVRDSRFTTKGHGEFVRRHMAMRAMARGK